jgi:hypothetical protein
MFIEGLADTKPVFYLEFLDKKYMQFFLTKKIQESYIFCKPAAYLVV